VIAKSITGIDTPIIREPRLSLEELFLCLRFMVGCMGALRSAVLGSVVSTLYSPPPLLIDTGIGGGFKTLSEETAMTIANQLFNKAFHSTRDPRSEAYKAGVLDTLKFKESGQELKHPFDPGTAESDAWIAGNQEGHNIWRSEAEGDYKRITKSHEIQLAKEE
jgi:hypothetical protein